MKEFFVLSIKHSQRGENLTWYRPACCGYTWYLAGAGRYTQEEVDAKKLNEKGTKAIPCEEALGVARKYMAVPLEFEATRWLNGDKG